MMRRPPHQEMTDPRHERLMGTLTPKAASLTAHYEARARFFDPKVNPSELEHPAMDFLHTFRQTSGSVKGEFRKDFVEGTKNPPMPSLGLNALPGQTGNGASPNQPAAPRSYI